MYISLDTRDHSLAHQIASLLRATTLSECGPRDLALLYAAHVTFQLGDFSFSPSVQKLNAIVDAAPGEALQRLKFAVQNTDHRIVKLDEEGHALISETIPRDRFPFSISILHMVEAGNLEVQASKGAFILSARLLSDVRAGMEDAATRQVANQLREGAFELDGLDDLSEIPLGALAMIAQEAWRASQTGKLSEQHYSEAVSKLLRISSAQVLRASIAFSLPGIGPAISAALFASRIERHRPDRKTL